MLLSDEEIIAAGYKSGDPDGLLQFGRNVIAALLAKLQAMEMPEPAPYVPVYRPLYTAAQLQQAHAQGYAKGAAEQLSAEPSAKQFQTVDGKWNPFIDAQHEELTIADGRWPIRELYTRKESK